MSTGSTRRPRKQKTALEFATNRQEIETGVGGVAYVPTMAEVFRRIGGTGSIGECTLALVTTDEKRQIRFGILSADEDWTPRTTFGKNFTIWRLPDEDGCLRLIFGFHDAKESVEMQFDAPIGGEVEGEWLIDWRHGLWRCVRWKTRSARTPENAGRTEGAFESEAKARELNGRATAFDFEDKGGFLTLVNEILDKQ